MAKFGFWSQKIRNALKRMHTIFFRIENYDEIFFGPNLLIFLHVFQKIIRKRNWKRKNSDYFDDFFKFLLCYNLLTGNIENLVNIVEKRLLNIYRAE